MFKDEKLLNLLKLYLKTLTPDERLEYISEILEGYCRHCGSDDPNCQCWNDE